MIYSHWRWSLETQNHQAFLESPQEPLLLVAGFPCRLSCASPKKKYPKKKHKNNAQRICEPTDGPLQRN